MDPNLKKFPIVSYVISRLPHPGLKAAFDSGPNSSLHADLEQPPSPRHTGVSPTASSPGTHLVAEMPHLNDPEVMSSMALAVSEVAQTRSILQTLGDRPDHETVDGAKAKISEIDARLATQQEEIALSPRSPDVDRLQWRAHLADKEDECRRATEEERRMYKAVIQLDEMHEAYQKLLKDAEDRLSKIYDSAASGGVEEDSTGIPPVKEEVNEEVVGILQEATGKGIERVDLSGRQLRILPEAFGLLRDLVVFNLSSNQLKSIPDSIAGLQNLEELHLSSNLLESLPDSIGLLHNLRIVNASGNKLSALPDSICHCRSLVELDVSFNCLTFLPTNIGHELGNLRRLSVQLNKIRSLPTSIGEMRSLRILDAHFNELHGMPITVGRLTSLEVLNLSSNFSDLTELPDTIGELTNLQELDLSNNQIHALPDAFGRLDSLVKLNLDQNPLVVPPKEAVDEGVEAVKAFMAKRWLDVLLVEEERCSMMERKEQVQTGWLSRSTSWLSDVASGVSESVTGYLGSPRKAPRDPYLDQSF